MDKIDGCLHSIDAKWTELFQLRAESLKEFPEPGGLPVEVAIQGNRTAGMRLPAVGELTTADWTSPQFLRRDASTQARKL